MNRFGVSGSVILSNLEQIQDLFWDGIGHVEIGEFANQLAGEVFIREIQRRKLSFGVHAPFIRDKSKNDLLHHIPDLKERAWMHLEEEARQVGNLEAEYLLVHFPYVHRTNLPVDGEGRHTLLREIHDGFRKLSEIGQTCGIEIVCEPKLGPNRSTAGIDLLHHYLMEYHDTGGLGLCIDLGDYLLAGGDWLSEMVDKWLTRITHVHLHNVDLGDTQYTWIPVHPSYERDDIHFPQESYIRRIGQRQCITFIFEHTPHSQPTRQQVDEGVAWVRSLTGMRLLDHQ